jgi:hypothetical protein
MKLRSSIIFALTTLCAIAGVCAAAAAYAAASITYSPLTGIGVGPSGPATAKITTEPFCCPSDALLVKATTPVGEADFQWVNLGLTVPRSMEFRSIRGVEVCYSLKTGKKGATYISQTRLADMTTPDRAIVEMDDPTDRTDPGPTCYTSKGGFSPKGTVTLSLKVVFGDVADEIRIGMVRLYF